MRLPSPSLTRRSRCTSAYSGATPFVRRRQGNFNRRENTGSRVAVTSDYAGALRLGHTVIPVVHEVFGGWGRRAVKLFHQLARCHQDELSPAHSSWACSSWTAYHAQRISFVPSTRDPPPRLSPISITCRPAPAHPANAPNAAMSHPARVVAVAPGAPKLAQRG